MKREIVINASALEVRVALLEDGSLNELYLERQQHRGLAGNIYKGKVTRVLPGMQAAFVDIGLDKAGFLHVSDFHDDVQAVGSMAEVIGEDDVETYPVDGEGGDEQDLRQTFKTCKTYKIYKNWLNGKNSKSRKISQARSKTIDRPSGKIRGTMRGRARAKTHGNRIHGKTDGRFRNGKPRNQKAGGKYRKPRGKTYKSISPKRATSR